jgi:hypothetical protein
MSSASGDPAISNLPSGKKESRRIAPSDGGAADGHRDGTERKLEGLR